MNAALTGSIVKYSEATRLDTQRVVYPNTNALQAAVKIEYQRMQNMHLLAKSDSLQQLYKSFSSQAKHFLTPRRTIYSVH